MTDTESLDVWFQRRIQYWQLPGCGCGRKACRLGRPQRLKAEDAADFWAGFIVGCGANLHWSELISCGRSAAMRPPMRWPLA